MLRDGRYLDSIMPKKEQEEIIQKLLATPKKETFFQNGELDPYKKKGVNLDKIELTLLTRAALRNKDFCYIERKDGDGYYRR